MDYKETLAEKAIEIVSFTVMGTVAVALMMALIGGDLIEFVQALV